MGGINKNLKKYKNVWSNKNLGEIMSKDIIIFGNGKYAQVSCFLQLQTLNKRQPSSI